MLYPLSFQVQSEHEQHDDIDHESLVGDQSESVDNSLEDQPIQQGPMTCSHTKALMKANLLMSEHFGIDNSFYPEETVQSEESGCKWTSIIRQAVNCYMQIFQLNFESTSTA